MKQSKPCEFVQYLDLNSNPFPSSNSEIFGHLMVDSPEVRKLIWINEIICKQKAGDAWFLRKLGKCAVRLTAIIIIGDARIIFLLCLLERPEDGFKYIYNAKC